MGERRNAYRLLVGKPEGKRLLERPRCEWIILKWILERRNGVILTSSLAWWSVKGSCKHSNEPSDFMKCWEFLAASEVVLSSMYSISYVGTVQTVF
jgi:hypothetical protein